MIPRAEFLTHLAGGTMSGGKDGRWRAEFDTAQVADWQPGVRAQPKPLSYTLPIRTFVPPGTAGTNRFAAT